MSILFTLKGELDRRLYWIQMRQEALRFISGYRRNNIIDISFPEKGFNRWSGWMNATHGNNRTHQARLFLIGYDKYPKYEHHPEELFFFFYFAI